MLNFVRVFFLVTLTFAAVFKLEVNSVSFTANFKYSCRYLLELQGSAQKCGLIKGSARSHYLGNERKECNKVSSCWGTKQDMGVGTQKLKGRSAVGLELL